MWTLGGRYLQTVGTFKSWKKIEDDGLPEDFDYSIPPDIKRIASSTTLRVSEPVWFIWYYSPTLGVVRWVISKTAYY